MKNSGVYIITNMENNHCYIGSAANVDNRKSVHWHLLKNGKHHSRYFQNAWDKYGEESFIFSVLTLCPHKLCIEMEQFFIDRLKPEYNMTPKAGSRIGCKEVYQPLPEEHRLALLNANIGKKCSDEKKAKISIGNKGRKQSEAERAMRRDAMGKPEVREKLRCTAILAFSQPEIRQKYCIAQQARHERERREA